MTFRTRIARAFCPAYLPLPHATKAHGRDHMIDHMAGEHYSVTGSFYEITNGKIVGKIVSDGGISADFSQRIFAYCDCGTQAKLHAFEEICHQHACSHLDRHTDGVQCGPKAAKIFPAIYTCD